MNKVEAMEWAADYAERTKIFEAPVNSRGYTIDGWRGISSAERAEVIAGLANQVVEDRTYRADPKAIVDTLEAIVDRLEKAKSPDPVRYTPIEVANAISRIRELIKEIDV